MTPKAIDRTKSLLMEQILVPAGGDRDEHTLQGHALSISSGVKIWISVSRGNTCRVQHHQVEGGIGFVIRHGDLLKRIDVLDERSSRLPP